ncbi:MAG: hypothetical protein M4579_002059 [Chaenotheca gracillima]|nr:MAG: hypothetical protein M4579_002059 [Chaenotheca gracillima]
MVRHKKDQIPRKKQYSRHPHQQYGGPPESDETSASRPAFKAACWDLGHCDPKRCSGKKLMKLRLMRELHIGQKFAGVVVSPNAKKTLSPADKDIMEQFGAAVVECSWARIKEVPFARIGGKNERLRHQDWAEEVMSHFSYGEAFLEINASLLKRYAACADEESVKKAESVWLDKLEREYATSREKDKASVGSDAWEGGNMNHRQIDESEEEDSEVEVTETVKKNNEDGDEGHESSEENEEGRDPYALSEPSDDEEEMAELRKRVLLSKPFSNPSDTDQKAQPEKIVRPTPVTADSDNDLTDSDGDNDEFDNIIDATPVTDRTGIQAKQRVKGQDTFSAVFSRNTVNAPKRW